MSRPSFYLFSYPRTEKYSLLIKLLLSNNNEEGGLFQKILVEPFKDLVNWVDSPTKADYLVLPLNMSSALKLPDYYKEFVQFSRQYDLKPFTVMHSDYAEPNELPEGIVLRTSGYRTKLLPNETIIPAFVEDLGQKHGHVPRKKNKAIPTIGFTGMVKLPSAYHELKYNIRLLRQWLKIRFRGASPASYQGLFYRRIAVRKIKSSRLCSMLFHIRDSFGRNVKTINVDPEQSRNEFVDSIVNSDLALVIRGDGNYSLRLFEVLSLGRIPLFIDTDSPLPLEYEIDYDSFMLRVDYTQMKQLPEIVSEFWQNCSEEKYIDMQKKAREAFVTKLRADVFYKELFQKLKTI